jgi:hypothetical protein
LHRSSLVPGLSPEEPYVNDSYSFRVASATVPQSTIESCVRTRVRIIST